MAISPISFKAETKTPETSAKVPTPAVKEKTADGKKKSDIFEKQSKKDLPPIAIGLGSALLWFGVGFGFDKLLGACFKNLKSDNKISLAINGGFGVIMGVMAFWKASKEQ